MSKMQASANVVDPALGDRRPSPRPYRPLPGPGARGARPRQAWWPWPLVIAVSTLCAVAAALGGWEAPFRPALVLWFVLVCPGMALVRLLRLGEPVTEWTLAVALSVTLDIIIAGTMLYAGLWSPPGTLAVLGAVSLAGAIAQLKYAPGGGAARVMRTRGPV